MQNGSSNDRKSLTLCEGISSSSDLYFMQMSSGQNNSPPHKTLVVQATDWSEAEHRDDRKVASSTLFKVLKINIHIKPAVLQSSALFPHTDTIVYLLKQCQIDICRLEG